MKVTTSRRDFLRTAGAAGTLLTIGGLYRAGAAPGSRANSEVFRVDRCPVHDNERRHRGVDALFRLLAARGKPLYDTSARHPWGAPGGLVARDDVVLIKVNCQWKCRGTTNTDVLRGVIHRILQHPEGFTGEVVVIENGQGEGAFDGDPHSFGRYAAWPSIDQGIRVNAEDETNLTVDHLVKTVFAGEPVGAVLLDRIRRTFISASDHVTEGYRKEADVCYPCFLSPGGRRIELKEGIWNGSTHDANLKLINLPVLKHHTGTGITGALKNSYGILSMADGHNTIRHYSAAGAHCGKMWIHSRPPVLNIVDCIWVSHGSLEGYPVATTARVDTLLAGVDPVALDYHAARHVLLPLGGAYGSKHDPDNSAGLASYLADAQSTINAGGGIGGFPTNQGDANIDLVTAEAEDEPSPGVKANGADGTLTLPAGTTVDLTVSLVAASHAGRPADQWILARTPAGWRSFAGGTWVQGFRSFSKNPLADRPATTVFQGVLPAGEYSFFAIVDANADGVLDASWWDSIRIRIL